MNLPHEDSRYHITKNRRALYGARKWIEILEFNATWSIKSIKARRRHLGRTALEKRPGKKKTRPSKCWFSPFTIAIVFGYTTVYPCNHTPFMGKKLKNPHQLEDRTPVAASPAVPSSRTRMLFALAGMVTSVNV